MKVRLDFSGILGLCKVLNKEKEFEFEFPGHTLGELVESLVRRFGPPMTKALLDLNGEVDMEIRVVLNHETPVTENVKEAALSEGDIVAFKGAG
jgi:molybdopterin converting factor small subunit